jgi:hypothetical protein
VALPKVRRFDAVVGTLVVLLSAVPVVVVVVVVDNMLLVLLLCHSPVDDARNALSLTRWDKDKPAHMSNVVLLTNKQIAMLRGDGCDCFGAAVRERIEARLSRVHALFDSV